MKKILWFLSGLAVVPLFTSCADYGVYGVATPAPIIGNPGFVGGDFVNNGAVGGLAPLQVGFVATTFDRWAWDPYCRHYYDRSCGRYWDFQARRYCTVVPRRFPTAVYPVGYRRSARLACPSYLPRTPVVVNRGPRIVNNNQFVNINSNRGRDAPVVHGTSCDAIPLQNQSRSNTYSRGGSSTRFNSPAAPMQRTVSPVSSRGTVTPSKAARNSNLKTISTGSRGSSSSITNVRQISPSRYSKTPSRSTSSNYSTLSRPSANSSHSTAPSTSRSAPTIRKSAYTPSRSSTKSSSHTRSSTSSRSSSYSKTSSRSTSSVSRSMNKARQRTR